MTKNPSIAYLNQFLLEHPSLLPALMDIDPRLPGLIHGHNDFDIGHDSSWYTLIGKDTTFCRNPGTFKFSKSSVDWSLSGYSFEQVSDQRCVNLRDTHWHKPWVILWSGGIDSTVMMTSILRNISPSDFKNIQVWCNRSSVYENPKFFRDHIQPNFEVISDRETNRFCRDVFVFGGEPGFILGLEKYKIYAEQSGIDGLGRDLRWNENKDSLVAYCHKNTVSTSTIEFANWLYNSMEENIRSTGLPIHTVREWWWWLLFNQSTPCFLMQQVDQFCFREQHSSYLENFVPWFYSDGYQSWAVHNLDKIATMKHKSLGKQYIHTVLKDQCYLDFKMKLSSTGRYWKQKSFSQNKQDLPRNKEINDLSDDRLFCVMNTGNCLYLDRDFDQIVNLLPEHINLDSLDYLN